MPALEILAAGGGAVLLIIFALWRISSRRRTLPCPYWLAWMVEAENPLARANHSRAVVQGLGLARGMTVLDAGCGPGRITIPLAKAVGPDGMVVAADLQDGMLQRVTAKAQSTGLSNVTTRQLGIGHGKLESGTFDRAVAAAVIGEIPDRDAAIHELFRCLKPGGRLAVAELIFDPHFQTRSFIRQLALHAGFTEHAFYGKGFAYMLVFERPR